MFAPLRQLPIVPGQVIVTAAGMAGSVTAFVVSLIKGFTMATSPKTASPSMFERAPPAQQIPPLATAGVPGQPATEVWYWK